MIYLPINIEFNTFISFQDSDNCWWDSFANEFFEDDATLTLTFCLEDGPKRYSNSNPHNSIFSLYFNKIDFSSDSDWQNINSKIFS